MSIVVTGATGHLGRHVIEGLLEKVPADQITAVVCDAEKAAGFAARGARSRSRRLQRARDLRDAPRRL